MAGAARQHAPIFSVASFRAWLKSRPDEEHWELIEGIPVMMTPPNRRHQRIASNLEWHLSSALKRHDPGFAAYRDIGVNISPDGDGLGDGNRAGVWRVELTPEIASTIGQVPLRPNRRHVLPFRLGHWASPSRADLRRSIVGRADRQRSRVDRN